MVTQREMVWKGACGIRPLGKGIPSKPAMPVVKPRRNMSQWKPAGLRSGNSVPWAMREETVKSESGKCRRLEEKKYRCDRNRRGWSGEEQRGWR